MKKNKKILDGHIKEGHDFVPKIKSILNINEIDYINSILPEIIWIGFFIKQFGNEKGSQIVLKFLEICNNVVKDDKANPYYFISGLIKVNEDNFNEISIQLKENRILEDFTRALIDFIILYPENNPFNRIICKSDNSIKRDSAILKTKDVIHDIFNRRSELSMIIQSIVCISDIENGNLHHVNETSVPDFKEILRNPNSSKAKELYGRVRMYVNSSFMKSQENIGTSWAEYFWQNGITIEKIQSPISIENIDSYKSHPILMFSKRFTHQCHILVNEIWTNLPINIYESNEFEVIGALISRQTHLAIKMSKSPDIWDVHISPLVLRSMIDCYITLAWILKIPKERARLYISYGLGQEKLHVEHLISQLSEEMEQDELSDMKELIQIHEDWINSQHYYFLQDVRIGSWSGINTREMAKDVGILSTYNSLYTPWSFTTHNMWNHTSKFDVNYSDNPLHKFLRSPSYFHSSFEYDFMYNVSKYLSKSLKLVIDKFDLDINIDLPDKWFEDNINYLIEGLNKNN